MFGYGGRFVLTGAIVITLIGSPDGAAPPAAVVSEPPAAVVAAPPAAVVAAPPAAVVAAPPAAVVAAPPAAVVAAAGDVPAVSSSSPQAARTINGTIASDATSRRLARLVRIGMHEKRM